jgi:alpha-glucuronidase
LKNRLLHVGNEGFVVWDSLRRKMVEQRQSRSVRIEEGEFNNVRMLLKIQHENAVKWRDGSVLYSQTLSRLPIPEELEKPKHNLEYYMTHNPR